MNSHESALSIAGGTHIGQRRLNEDAVLVDEALGLVLVADGVGGHEAGDVASAITCDVISSGVAAGLSLQDAVGNANREVKSAVIEGRGKEGMASTVVAAQFSHSRYHIAWVGDSRAYLWDGHLKLLTRDHSYVESLVKQGQITREEARNHPRKHVIAQAIGVHDDSKLQVDGNQGSLAAGQLLLLCSDGLSDVVGSADICRLLAMDSDLQERCDSLVNAAVDAGGKDNISVVLVASAEPAGAGDSTQPNVVWSFDPASETYSEDAAPGTATPTVTRVKPRKPGNISVDDTQLISPEDLAKRRAAAPPPSAPRRPRRVVLWLMLAGVAAAALVYSFGVQGLHI